MLPVNYVIHGCSISRTTPGVITIQKLDTGGKTLLQLLLKTDETTEYRRQFEKTSQEANFVYL